MDDFFTPSVISAAAVTFFEFIYHRFFSRTNTRQSPNQQNTRENREQFQTEAAEDLTPVKPDVRSPKNDKD